MQIDSGLVAFLHWLQEMARPEGERRSNHGRHRGILQNVHLLFPTHFSNICVPQGVRARSHRHTYTGASTRRRQRRRQLFGAALRPLPATLRIESCALGACVRFRTHKGTRKAARGIASATTASAAAAAREGAAIVVAVVGAAARSALYVVARY